VHPYEEAAIDVYDLATLDSGTGLGRIGVLQEPTTLHEFTAAVARELPATPAGVRFAGDPARRIASVAVCGGAGDSLLSDAAAAGVDAFVTADLRHHPASEHLAAGGPALVDPGHWASEWPWLRRAADVLAAGLAGTDGRPTTVEISVSSLVTDPFAGHAPSRPLEEH